MTDKNIWRDEDIALPKADDTDRLLAEAEALLNNHPQVVGMGTTPAPLFAHATAAKDGEEAPAPKEGTDAAPLTEKEAPAFAKPAEESGLAQGAAPATEPAAPGEESAFSRPAAVPVTASSEPGASLGRQDAAPSGADGEETARRARAIVNEMNTQMAGGDVPPASTGGAPAHPAPGRKRKGGIGAGAVALLVVLSLLCGLVGGVVGGRYLGKPTVIYKTAEPSSDTSGSEENPAPATDGVSTLSYSAIVGKVYDTVVEVVTENVSYDAFFGQGVTSGAGSGVILSEDGYIVTNNHVVNGATKITVTTTSGQSYTAKLVGTDGSTDIAVLKIDAAGLTPAVLGSSSSLKVGDFAMAIGNPLGTLGGTVTTGIISALDRPITVEGLDMKLMQTSAAVNPGNSGGGLFNSAGELVGVVNAKSAGEDVEGLGFAIPVDEIKDILNSIIENGYVTGRPAIGITILDITTEAEARQYGVTRFGVYVYTVNEDGGAHGKLEEGDYIVSVDGMAVTTSNDITAVLATHAVGDTVEVQVIRGRNTVTYDIVLGELK